MTAYSKFNFVYRLQKWMDSVPGQTFLNYAYSWGASIVILGALFKLTHLPGGNVMLFIGMGTEVIVFFISAFDRPFDKEQIGKVLPKEYIPASEEEEMQAVQVVHGGEGIEFPPVESEDDSVEPQPARVAAVGGTQIVGGGMSVAPASGVEGGVSGGVVSGGGGVVVVGGGVVGGGSAVPPIPASATGEEQENVAAATTPVPAAAVAAMPQDTDAQQLAAIIRAANDELLHRAQAVLSPEMEEATKTYIEKLQILAETFEKVDEQSARLTKDSEEMENLNRTLTGINKVYELHLKSISLQVGTIDEINNQTKKLSEQIQHLNQVYGRMIDALTVNMPRGAASTPTEG